MRCHNHQVADSSNNSDHNIMKQVRFASDNNSNSESQEKPCETGVNGDLQIQFGPQLKLLSRNDRELQTIIRLVVEEGLNQLPYTECIVTTPTGHKYEGVKFERGNCGISIMRSGEAMEQGLRDCCRSIRIGKILIQCDETLKAKVYYAKLPPDIYRRDINIQPTNLNWIKWFRR